MAIPVGLVALVVILLALKLFIFKPYDGPRAVAPKPDGRTPEEIEAMKSLEEEYQLMTREDGTLGYDPNQINSGFYSDNKKEDTIPDDEVEKLKIVSDNLKTSFDFEKSALLLQDEGKRYNSAKNERFVSELVPEIEDLTIMSNLPYSYISQEAYAEDMLQALHYDKNFLIAILSIDPDYRIDYVYDMDSKNIALCRVVGEDSNPHQYRIVRDFEEIPLSDYTKRKVPGVDLVSAYSMSFKYEDNEFKVVMAKDGAGKRYALGIYEEMSSVPYPTVAEWKEIVRNKREMRDESSSIWQEDGPQDNLAPDYTGRKEDGYYTPDPEDEKTYSEMGDYANPRSGNADRDYTDEELDKIIDGTYNFEEED